jgi:sulfur-oxidizing protein SoxZ
MANSRIQVPARARRGEVIEVRVLIQHGMETGFRQDDVGRFIPRNVLRTLECRYNGAEVLKVELSSGVSANPYFLFHLVAQDSGDLVFTWVDDADERGDARQALVVTG